jgi:hypothetical protein
MHSAAALRGSHHSLYPLAGHAPIRSTRAVSLRRFACREGAPTYHTPAHHAPVHHAPTVPTSRPCPVERSLRQADALALSLRTGLDRIAIPLSRAAAAFVQRES